MTIGSETKRKLKFIPNLYSIWEDRRGLNESRRCAYGIVSSGIELKRKCKILNRMCGRYRIERLNQGKGVRIFFFVIGFFVAFRGGKTLDMIRHHNEAFRLRNILLAGILTGQKCQEKTQQQQIFYGGPDHIIYRWRWKNRPFANGTLHNSTANDTA